VVPDPINKAQRLWPRWFIAGAKPVKVDLGPAGSGPLVDISGGGFRVQSLAPLRRGAEVPVRIEIPDHREGLECSGIVVWSKPNGAAGVRFAGLNENQKSLLHSWLAELEKAAAAPTQAHQQDEFTTVVSEIRGAQLNNGDALNMIARRAKELNAVSGVAIALGTPENMVCMAAVGEAPQVGSAIPAVIGLTGECVFKRKMIHCEDSRNDPRVGRESGFGSAVVLPLVVNNEVRGVVQVFSKRSYGFTVTSIDALEKLADAIVFVAYGIVTQRRLATAKSSLPSANTNVGPKPPAAPLSPLTASWAAPSAPPADTQTMRASEPAASPARLHDPVSVVKTSPATMVKAVSPPAAPQALPFEPEPLARSIAEPISVPIRRTVERERRAALKPVGSPRRQVAQSAERSSSGKWIGILVALLVVSAPAAWWYRTHHTQAESVANATPATSSEAVTESQPEPESAKAESLVPLVAPAGENATATTDPHHATAIEHAPPQAAKHEERHEVEAVAARPEPIILSANRAKALKPLDLDSVVPVKLPPTVLLEGSAKGIALPAPSKSEPKLAAELPVVRTPATLSRRVDPVYPPMAKTAHMQGPVELLVEIGKDGSVTQVRRLSGQPILASAAIDAVKQWRYNPAKVNGQPVETEMTVRLTFDLYR
jgi:TonB family protein